MENMDRSRIERVVSGAVSSALSRLCREELALSVNATSQSRNVTDSDVDDEIQEGSSILPTRKRLLYMTLVAQVLHFVMFFVPLCYGIYYGMYMLQYLQLYRR